MNTLKNICKGAIIMAAVILFFSVHSLAGAQALHPGEEILKGTIAEIVYEREVEIPASHIIQKTQFLRVALANGEEASVQYDGQPLTVGQRVLVGKVQGAEGETLYLFRSIDRRGSYILLTLLFIAASVWVAGRKGIRALLALIFGIGALLKILIPVLATTHHIMLFGMLICFAILFLMLIMTYGIKRDVMISFAGISIGLVIVALITAGALAMGHFSGLSIESNIFLAYSTGTVFNMRQLLLVAMLIGVFGILDDIAITQVSIVAELKFVNPHLAKKDLFVSALRVGRSHAAALINTLFFAYAGTLLPSILYVRTIQYPASLAINQEIFGIEIVRILSGSIGFLLIIPITTAFAVFYAKPEAVRHEGHVHI
jgi:uncharacterized membrane protein